MYTRYGHDDDPDLSYQFGDGSELASHGNIARNGGDARCLDQRPRHRLRRDLSEVRIRKQRLRLDEQRRHGLHGHGLPCRAPDALTRNMDLFPRGDEEGSIGKSRYTQDSLLARPDP